MSKGFAVPKLKSAMEADGALPSYMPGKQFQDFTAAELKRWGEVERSANVKAK